MVHLIAYVGFTFETNEPGL